MRNFSSFHGHPLRTRAIPRFHNTNRVLRVHDPNEPNCLDDERHQTGMYTTKTKSPYLYVNVANKAFLIDATKPDLKLGGQRRRTMDNSYPSNQITQ